MKIADIGWFDDQGAFHIDLHALMQKAGVPDTEENRRMVEQEIYQFAKEQNIRCGTVADEQFRKKQ